MPSKPGEYIGGYRIHRVLGAGGMGTVYLAKHPKLPRLNAVKVLSGDLGRDAGFRARFEREANLAASLDHPNLISIYDRGEENGQLWISMSYIDGSDAAIEVAKGPKVMTVARALRIVTEVGKGLDYAHQRGLLHRDVKPANFLLSGTDPAEERVVLTDFGVARSNEDTLQLTQTGTFVATMAYAAPEQLLGHPLDHRTDIYALGCALTKLLTGRDAYPSTVPATVMMGHLHEPPPRPSLIRPELPQAIDAVVAKALAKNPAHRYNSCREFAADAANALADRTHRAPPNLPATYLPASRPPNPRGTGGRTGTIVAVTAVLAILAAIGIVVAVNSGGSDGGGRQAAATSVSTTTARETTTRNRSTPSSLTTRSSTRTSSSTPAPLPSSNADCTEYERIKADVNAAMDVPAPDYGDRAAKYNSIADLIEPAASATPAGEVQDTLSDSAAAARTLADRAAAGGATEDELEGLRLQYVDPWVALSFICL